MGDGRTVAVIKGLDGALGDPSGGGRVEFWAKDEGRWTLTRTFDFDPLLPPRLKDAGSAVGRLAEELKVASAVAAKGFPDLAFQALLKAGPALCEMPEFQPEWLDDILDAALDPSWEDETASLTPVESPPGSGVFEIDLGAALAAAPELSSKRILKPFLEAVPFLELRVLFDHFPPWLEGDLKRRGLGCRYESRNSGMLITISPERFASS
jgi:hypothetical protein